MECFDTKFVKAVERINIYSYYVSFSATLAEFKEMLSTLVMDTNEFSPKIIERILE